MIEACGLMPEGAGQPGFAGARLAGKDDLLLGLDPRALGQRQDLAAVEAPAGGEVGIFDAGIGEAHLCISKPVGEAFIGSCRSFPIEHEPEPFIAIEGLTRVVNERLKLTRFQRLNLTHPLWRKAPSRAALI